MTASIRPSAVGGILQRIVPAFLMVPLLLASGPMQAQEQQESFMDKMLAEDRVKATIELALRNIERAKCAPDQECAPATQEELAKPPILVSDARAAIKAGINSALLQWCGLDWRQRSFLPLVTNYRDILLMNDRQMALIGLIHGMQQGLTLGGMAGKPCSNDTRKRIDARVPRRQLTR